jgi:hypothetical protein
MTVQLLGVMDDKRGFRQSIHLWWNGEYKVHDADMYFEQRWTSRACHSVVDYLRQHHWKLIMALIAGAGIWWALRGRS